MKVLLFPASYAPVVGGLQTVAQSLAKNLRLRGHEVRVVTNRYPRSLRPHEEIDGVRVDRLLLLEPQLDLLRRRRLDMFLGSLYYGPQKSRRLNELLKQFQPDVVNVHFPDNQIPSILNLQARFDFRLVVSLHGHDVQRFVNGDGRKNGARANGRARLSAVLKSADAVTAVSDDLLRKVITLEPAIAKKTRVIPNGVESSYFATLVEYQHSRPYILAVGRLVRAKGFDMLVEAFAQSDFTDRPDLIIAGAGEEFAALQDQVQRLGLTAAVHFFGQASCEDVVKLMNGSVGVVVPSREEAFGIVALEAVAAGKRLVATETGGMIDLLNDLAQQNDHTTCAAKDRRIILVPPSVHGVAAGLHELLAPTNTECSRNELSIPEKYTWPHVAHEYERVFLAGRAN